MPQAEKGSFLMMGPSAASNHEVTYLDAVKSQQGKVKVTLTTFNPIALKGGNRRYQFILTRKDALALRQAIDRELLP